MNWRLISIYMIISISIFQSGVDFQLSMFIYHTPRYKCMISNQSGNLIAVDSCHYYTIENPTRKHKCTKWIFDKSQIPSTFVTDLLLICKRKYLQLIIVPMRNICAIFVVILGWVSDRKGRKKIFLICALLDTILWILLGIIPYNYTAHFILRISKIFGIASSIIGFVLACELTPNKYRNFIIINLWSISGIGYAFSPLYVSTMANWQSAWLLAACPMCFYLLAPSILLESPKWLIMNGRKDDALIILKKLNQDLEDKENCIDNPFVDNSNHKLNNEHFSQSTLLVKRLCVLLLSSLSFYLVYNGISTNLEFAMSNIYYNAMIMGLIEIPAGFLGSLSNKYIGSVKSVILWTLVGIISLVLSPNNWNHNLAKSKTGQIIHIVLATLGKFFIIVSWNISSIFYISLFPTNDRSLTTIIGEVSGFIGAAIGSFIGYYFKNIKIRHLISLSNMIYGLVLIIAITIFGLVIPSVNDIELPNTVEEAKMIKKSEHCTNSEHEDE